VAGILVLSFSTTINKYLAFPRLQLVTTMKLHAAVKFRFNMLFIFLLTFQTLTAAAGGAHVFKKRQASQYIILNGIDATPEAFQEIETVFGKPENRARHIGAGFIISYLQHTPAR
jgi:hypothetical protein